MPTIIIRPGITVGHSKTGETQKFDGPYFGMVLIEAFATATPVVASDIPGFAAVATPDAATLVPPGDENALVDALEALLADEDRRIAMGIAGRKLAAERYSWEDVARRLEATYLRVAA